MTGWLLSSTVLVGVVLLLRRVLRRHLHPAVLYALWLLAAARLLLPFTVGTSDLSLSTAASALPLVRQAEALLPVCGAKFTRITAPLRLSEKTSCTLCGDLGELTGGGKKELLCELELELQAGEEADVQAFAKTLAERFHLHEQPRSKLQRARALTQ